MGYTDQYQCFFFFPFLAPFIRFSRPTSKHLPLPCADFHYLALIHDSIGFGEVQEGSGRFEEVWEDRESRR